MVVNEIAPIGAPAPEYRQSLVERIEGSKNFASGRLTAYPKSPLLAGRTFDLVRHDGKLRVRPVLFPSF
jgi:hypothetical protein